MVNEGHTVVSDSSGSYVYNKSSGEVNALKEEYGNYMNRLAGLTDMGQASAGNMAAAGNAYASGAGNALAGKGNAQAAGAIGGANAWSGALNNGIAAYQYQTMLNGAG